MEINKKYGEFGTSLIPVWPPASTTSLHCSWKIGDRITVGMGKAGKKRQYEGVVIAFREALVLVVYLKPRHVKHLYTDKKIVCEWVPIKECLQQEEKIIEEWLTSEHPILRPYFLKCQQHNVNLLVRPGRYLEGVK